VNSKEENSEDFCPNYVQEFSLWPLLYILYFCVTFLILFTYLYMPDILGLLIYIDTAACKLYTVFNKFSSRGDNIGFREEAKRINIHREKTIRSSVQDVFPICYEFLVVP
jgi:hypothetical protein